MFWIFQKICLFVIGSMILFNGLIAASRAASPESVNFRVGESVMGGGGEKSSSFNWTEQATIGEPAVIGISTSTRYTVKGGFQYFDETAPYTKDAVLNDGLGEDIDEQTSLDTISANWNGIFDPESGLDRARPYEASLERQSDGLAWNPVGLVWQEHASFFTTSTRITLSKVDMQTDEIYFFKLRAINTLKMVSSWIKSDGLRIISYLSFRLDDAAVSLGELAPGNNFTGQATSTFLVSTNSFYGYQMGVQSLRPLTHAVFSDQQIVDWPGANAEPLLWDKECPEGAQYCGFGYRTTDADLGGGRADRFALGPYFAGFNHTEAELAADHPGPITGQSGEIRDEKAEIVYRVSVNDEQPPGQYGTIIVYTVGANY